MQPPFGTWPSNSPPSWRATLWLPKTESYGATLLHYTKTAIRGSRAVGRIARSRPAPSPLHHQLRRHLRWHRRIQEWSLIRGNECKIIITIFIITIIKWDVRATRITLGHLVVRRMRWRIITWRDGCIDFVFCLFGSTFGDYWLTDWLTDWLTWLAFAGFHFLWAIVFLLLLFDVSDVFTIPNLFDCLIVWLGSDISSRF